MITFFYTPRIIQLPISVDTLPFASVLHFPEEKSQNAAISKKGKIYYNTISRDRKKLDICVADINTGEVKVLIEEKLVLNVCQLKKKSLTYPLYRVDGLKQASKRIRVLNCVVRL